MAEMTPEERVNLVLDIVAEEILRQMREMQETEQEAAQESEAQKRFRLSQEKLVPKPTIETAREEMKRIGFHPDKWGHYTVGMHRLKFFKDALRARRRRMPPR